MADSRQYTARRCVARGQAHRHAIYVRPQHSAMPSISDLRSGRPGADSVGRVLWIRLTSYSCELVLPPFVRWSGIFGVISELAEALDQRADKDFGAPCCPAPN